MNRACAVRSRVAMGAGAELPARAKWEMHATRRDHFLNKLST